MGPGDAFGVASAVSRFYNINPAVPAGGVMLAEYRGWYGIIRPGDMVMCGDLSCHECWPGGGPLRADELIELMPGAVTCILADGLWECDPWLLRPVRRGGPDG